MSGIHFSEQISGSIFRNPNLTKPEIPDPNFSGNPNAHLYLPVSCSVLASKFGEPSGQKSFCLRTVFYILNLNPPLDWTAADTFLALACWTFLPSLQCTQDTGQNIPSGVAAARFDLLSWSNFYQNLESCRTRRASWPNGTTHMRYLHDKI